MHRLLAVLAAACAVAYAPIAAGAVEPGAKPSYKTIIEGYDWGPGISRIVIDFGRPVAAASLAGTAFGVRVERFRPDGSGFVRVRDWATMASHDSVGERPVLAAYLSDAAGTAVRADRSPYITLALKVGPDEELANPFDFDFSDFMNKWIDPRHAVAVRGALAAADGTALAPLDLGPADRTGSLTPVADEFDYGGASRFADPRYGNIALRYASWSPPADGRKHPLVVWLHGAGEGGVDPRIAVLGNRVTALARDPVQSLMGGAYVLVPQTPLVWMNDGVRSYPADGGTQYAKALKNLIDEYLAKTPAVDRSRIYLGGCSNGGFMTMEMVLRYPDFFAAAWPVCEAYADRWIGDAQIEAIKKVPIWFTQAKSDATVKAAAGGYVLQTYRRLRDAGAGNVHLSYFDRVVDLSGAWRKPDGSPYEYNGHFSWIYALNDQCRLDFDGAPVRWRGGEVSLFAWMAAQRR